MRPSGARLSIEQAARGGQEPAQVRSSARSSPAKAGGGEPAPDPQDEGAQRADRGSPAPGCGDADPGGVLSPTLSGDRRDKGCGARPQLHVAPGSRPRELQRGGAVGWSPRRAGWGRPRGEHPDWAGTTGEAGPRGLLHRTTAAAAAPASRLLQACTRHRPQLGPTPRPPARPPRRDRSPESDAEQPRLRGARLCPAIPPRQSRR